MGERVLTTYCFRKSLEANPWMFICHLTGMHRKSLEAAEKLKESDLSSEEHHSQAPQCSSSGNNSGNSNNHTTTTASISSSKTTVQQPSFHHHHQRHHQGSSSSTSSSSRGSSPILGCPSTSTSSATLHPNKEDLRTSSIASLRAKAIEHSAKVFGEGRDIVNDSRVAKDAVGIMDRPSIHSIGSLF